MYGIDQKVYKISNYHAETVEIVNEYEVREENENSKMSRM